MTKLVTILAALLFALTGCSQTNSAAMERLTDDAKRMPGEIWKDTKNVVSSTENVAILLLAGGASGYVRCDQDDGIANHFEGHHTFSRDFTIAVGTAGNPGTHFAAAGAAYLYGLLKEDDQTRDVGYSLIEALSLTGLTTISLKLIAQDDSPNGELLAWPSGHTSSTVTVAAVLDEYYGPWVGLPLYALSGFVMYERMETGEHWASDLVFGAAIGYTIGKTVATRCKPTIFEMDVQPYISGSGAIGVALSKEF